MYIVLTLRFYLLVWYRLRVTTETLKRNLSIATTCHWTINVLSEPCPVLRRRRRRRLDKYWSDQELLYDDFKAKITQTRSDALYLETESDEEAP